MARILSCTRSQSLYQCLNLDYKGSLSEPFNRKRCSGPLGVQAVWQNPSGSTFSSRGSARQCHLQACRTNSNSKSRRWQTSGPVATYREDASLKPFAPTPLEIQVWDPLDLADSTSKSLYSKRLPYGGAPLASALVALALSACQPALAEVASPLAAASGSNNILNDFVGELGNVQDGFASAFLLIFFSEIGDKTFFIAVLLALRKSKIPVFLGTFGALALMTIISVVLGRFFHVLDEALPVSFAQDLPLDDIAAVVLLVYFGVTTLLDAASMPADAKADEEEREAELAVASIAGNGTAELSTAVSTILATFALVFVAEWGDKSFFSTIALAAAASPLGVVAGAVAGHGAATLIAVLGGSFLGERISPKVVAYTGGVLFLVFAVATTAEILQGIQ